MKVKVYLALTIINLILAVNVRADLYSTFQIKRFYSANRRCFVEVTEKKRATLYRNGRRFQRVWSRILPELPARLLVTNDGSRVAMIDFYYGNNHVPSAPVIIIFGEGGEEIARYPLKNVADLSRTTATTSTSYWFQDVKLMQDERWLVIETIVAKYDRSKCGKAHSPEESVKMSEICTATAPNEKLCFDMITGKLSSRENLASQ
jgi:hypothetical protein